ncbi:MAG: hypothetical protein HZY73_15625 [Micropruina sp.]|nr:MAG: hypothetical protein HZY73_15625 [Micropruina sp.]
MTGTRRAPLAGRAHLVRGTQEREGSRATQDAQRMAWLDLVVDTHPHGLMS